jgi:hypothetical protein
MFKKVLENGLVANIQTSGDIPRGMGILPDGNIEKTLILQGF